MEMISSMSDTLLRGPGAPSGKLRAHRYPANPVYRDPRFHSCTRSRVPPTCPCRNSQFKASLRDLASALMAHTLACGRDDLAPPAWRTSAGVRRA